MDLGETYIKLDRDWDMHKLAKFARLYTQCYSLVYSLSSPNIDPSDEYFIGLSRETYKKYFWRNGYGAGRFYDTLYENIPHGRRPQIKEIKYASPGYIMLMDAVVVAGSLAIIVHALTKSLDRVHDSYHRIQTGISKRKLAKLEVARRELELKEQEWLIRNSIAELSEQMEIPVRMQEELQINSGYNELKVLRILMSFIRRADPIAQMQSRGEVKIEIPND